MSVVTILFTTLGPFMLRASPRVIAVLAFLWWALVPSVATSIFWGGLPVPFHPATIFAISGLIWLAVDNPSRIGEAMAAARWLSLVVILFGGLALAVYGNGEAGGARSVTVDQIIGPFIIFVLFLAGSRGGAARLNCDPRWLFVTLAVFESGLVMVQALLNRAIPYADYFLSQAWYASGSWTRWMGTLDHPLAYAAIACVGIYASDVISSIILRIVMWAVCLSGIAVSESRVALVLAIVGTTWVVFATVRARGVRLVLFGAAILAAVSLWPALASGGLGGRFGEAGQGSNDARNAAVALWIDVAPTFLFVGDGGGSSYLVTSAAGLGSSFENPFLMYTVDFGLIASAMYFVAQIIFVVRLFRTWGATTGMSALVVFILSQGSVTVATESIFGPLIWLVYAVCLTGGWVTKPPVDAQRQFVRLGAWKAMVQK